MEGDDNIEIKIIGSKCSNGMKLSKMVDKAVEELDNNKINVEKLEKDNKYGITNFPGLVVDGKIISQGKILTVRELKRLFI